MVKNKNKLSTKATYLDYQIKTRYRIKKLSSMSREIKNLQENNSLQKIDSNNSKLKKSNIKKSKKKIRTKILKKIKTDEKSPFMKDIKINLNEFTNNLKIDLNGKNVNKKIEPKKKIYIEMKKYKYQNKEYFDLKEVLTFINEQLKINLDSPNKKIIDKEKFQIEMNELLNKFFIIYFNKILITEENLNIFLDFLSQYIKLEPKEILKLLNTKNIEQNIEEKIVLEQYFKPRLILVEK